MKKIIIFILLVVFMFAVVLTSSEVKKIEVTVKVANIRNLPNLKGEIIGKAVIGEIFKVENIDGSWYKVLVKKEGNKYGFLHKVTVKEIFEPKKNTKSMKEKVNKEKVVLSQTKKIKVKKNKIARRRNNFKQKKLFSGFYLKGGYMLSPSGLGFGESWISSIGFDSPIGGFLTWGFELQPFYRSKTVNVLNTTFSSIGGNAFLNIKAGVNMGILKNSLKFMNIYFGGGAGAQLLNQSVKFSGNTESEFIARFAWHILLGTEFDLGSINLIFDLQFNKTIIKNLDPSTVSSTFLLVGIRF